MVYKVIWSILSLKKLKEIITYISKSNPQNAVNFAQKLLEQTDKLINFPLSGRVVPEFNHENIREIIYKNYRIIYKINDTIISILTVRNARENL